MSSEYERIELRVVPHPRPLVLLGANDKVVIKELDALEDFTECTRYRDMEKVCIPVSEGRRGGGGGGGGGERCIMVPCDVLCHICREVCSEL